MVNQKKVNILLVDDNPNNIVTLEAILKVLEQNTFKAFSGEEALKLTLKHEFAVILMDAHMPGLNGFDVARLLRTRPKTRYTPIIFLSALHKDEMDVRQGYALGAVDYIFKPLSQEIIYSKVKVFVDLYSKSTHAQMLQQELIRRQKLELGYKQLAYQTQLILASVGEGICGVNAKGNITFANPTAAVLFDLPHEQLSNQPLLKILSKLEQQIDKTTWKQHPIYQVLNGILANYNGETQFHYDNGQKRAIEYTVNVIQDEKTKYRGAVIIFKDITERKRIEESSRKHQQQLELAHIAQLNTMKEMASATAHELTQPIAIIANYLKGCLHRFNENDYDKTEILNIMQRAIKQAERAGTVIHRIKNLVSKGEVYYKKTHINKIIEEILELISDDLAQITIKSSLGRKIPAVEVDEIQIQQVILNLIRNSLDAMSEMAPKERKLQIQTKINLENMLEVNIIDNGPGIDPAIANKLFETYFTTKPQGMGMGLSISRTIIEAHGGNLMIQPNPKGGAWFQFILPISKN